MQKRTERVTSLIERVNPGKIIELGCGSGLVLEALSEDFPDSIILGLDNDAAQLEKVVAKGLPNVVPVSADITEKIFPDGTFDTVLFVASLHEVYSYRGKRKVKAAFQMARDIMMPSGVLIIQDFLKPPARPVEMNFHGEEIYERFLRFAREFRPRKVKFEETEQGVKLDIADAVEFVSKYRSPDEQDWKKEMDETHFFFTQEEYHKLAQKTGFATMDVKMLPTDETWWAEIREDLELTLEPSCLWVQLVLTK